MWGWQYFLKSTFSQAVIDRILVRVQRKFFERLETLYVLFAEEKKYELMIHEWMNEWMYGFEEISLNAV